ncbi:MAG: riboflavin synthase [Bdellovibrionota bacterium]
MFTGLIQDTSRVLSYEKDQASDCWNLWVETSLSTVSWKIGDSIATNGVCLTVVALDGRKVLFQVGPETLKATNFKDLKKGQGLHLESSLKMGDPLGGHWVSGHVDAPARVAKRIQGQEVLTLSFSVEGPDRDKVAPFLVPKGSVAVDGVSLTVNAVRDLGSSTEFDVTLIPHTLKLTRFSELTESDTVNIEADLIAKHAARYAEYWKGTRS